MKFCCFSAMVVSLNVQLAGEMTDCDFVLSEECGFQIGILRSVLGQLPIIYACDPRSKH